MPRLTTKELSTKTWPDLERLYSQEGNGWNFCWCMVCQRGHHLSRTKFPNRAAQARQNRQEKKALVEADRSHGVIVYSDGEPVGWCQFGPKSELPLSDASELDDDNTWRITCFVTHKQFRQQGVSRVALRAALDAIRRRGGGLIEAHPLLDASSSYTGTVQLFESEGFKEAERFVVHSRPFPRYDRNRVINGKFVVVMHRTI